VIGARPTGVAAGPVGPGSARLTGMQLTLVLVIGIVSVVATSAVSERIGVAAPLSLVVLGIALSFLPGVHVHVDPELVLSGVLPPLLYASATRMPAHDFRRNFRTIFALAVYLVALTTVTSGYLVEALLPGVGLAAAFALGAVVSPTDAVAATSVGGKLGLPARLTTIIEGEGLVNDASALVLLASASTAIHKQTHVWRVGLDFVYSAAIATVVGVIVGLLGVWLRSLLDDAVFTTAISFALPFVAFLPAERLHASGVLAVVCAGLVAGALGPRHLSAQSRMAESINWRTIAFLLEGGIFLGMGLQLKTLWDDDSGAGHAPHTAIWVGLLVSALALALRVIFVAPIVARLRRGALKAQRDQAKVEELEQRFADPAVLATVPERRQARFRHRMNQHKADIAFSLTERFGWRGGAVLAWSGMRGAITVAAAQTLPENTPERAQLVLIAFTVAAATLIVQGVSLPWVIRRLDVPGDDPEADRAAYADLRGDMNDAAAVALADDELRDGEGTAYDPEVIKQVSELLRVRSERTVPTPDADDQNRVRFVELLTIALAAERTTMLQARSEGRYSSRVLDRAQRSLDMQETLLQRLPGPAG
jgi:monovalent cation/hydrogen antiporter